MSTGSSTSCDSKLIEETKSGPCTFLPASVFFLSWLQLSTRLAFLSRLNTGCLSVKHAHSGFLTDCNDLLTLQAHHISAGIHPLCIYICCIFSSPHCFRRPLTLEFLIPHTHTQTHFIVLAALRSLSSTNQELVCFSRVLLSTSLFFSLSYCAAKLVTTVSPRFRFCSPPLCSFLLFCWNALQTHNGA